MHVEDFPSEWSLRQVAKYIFEKRRASEGVATRRRSSRAARGRSAIEVAYPADERQPLRDGRPPWKRNEAPWPSTDGEATSVRMPTAPPRDQYEALMKAQPCQEPDPSLTELMQVREVMVDALDVLPAQLREVFDAVHSRRESYADAGRRLGYVDGEGPQAAARGKKRIERSLRRAEKQVKAHLRERTDGLPPYVRELIEADNGK